MFMLMFSTMMCLLIMLLKQISPIIPIKVAPNSVYVVCVVLGIVKFNQK